MNSANNTPSRFLFLVVFFWSLVVLATVNLFWYLAFTMGLTEGSSTALLVALGGIVGGMLLFAVIFSLWFSGGKSKKSLIAEEKPAEKPAPDGQRIQISTILHSIVDGVIALDFAGAIQTINPAAAKILDVKSEAVVGKKIEDILSLSENGAPVDLKELMPNGTQEDNGTIAQKRGVKVVNKLNSGKQPVFVDLTSSSIEDGRDIDLAVIITFNDATREKELEEMKLDFVSMAAHELRTPLTSVRGYLSVLMDELRKKVTPEQYSFLDKAFISSTQLASLVENLLSVARIERGSLQIQTQSTAWEAVVEEVFNNFVPQAKERKVNLTFVKPKKKLPLVLVDKFRISEVISNLVGNALNYTPSGGNVEISLEETPTEVITHIKDTGQGIPQAALPKLFTKFFRVSGVLEQGSKGTGLGLFISKAVVDMHKGKIWVESEVDKGSKFSFSVPRSTEQKPKVVTPGKRNFVRKIKTKW